MALLKSVRACKLFVLLALWNFPARFAIVINKLMILYRNKLLCTPVCVCVCVQIREFRTSRVWLCVGSMTLLVVTGSLLNYA